MCNHQNKSLTAARFERAKHMHWILRPTPLTTRERCLVFLTDVTQMEHYHLNCGPNEA